MCAIPDDAAPGPLRFDVYALWRIATQRKYKGTLRLRERGATEPITLESTFLMVWALNTKWATVDAQLAPRAEFDDGCGDILVIEKVASNVGRHVGDHVG